MRGNCACSAVTVELAAKPDFINLCDCSLCAPLGGAWGYFTTDQIKISGKTRAYRRLERAEPAVEVHFCPTCGTTTHWVLTEHFSGDRMGVNMRIFTPDQVAGIEARTLDGRGWDGIADPAERLPPGIVGKDVFL